MHRSQLVPLLFRELQRVSNTARYKAGSRRVRDGQYWFVMNAMTGEVVAEQYNWARSDAQAKARELNGRGLNLPKWKGYAAGFYVKLIRFSQNSTLMVEEKLIDGPYGDRASCLKRVLEYKGEEKRSSVFYHVHLVSREKE